jgi:hypothetical protein
MDQRLAMRTVAERVLDGTMSPASAAAGKADPQAPVGNG